MPSAAVPSTDDLIAQHQAELKLASSVSTDDLIKSHQQEIAVARKRNTPVESALQGAAQGVTLGFADELQGAYQAAKSIGSEGGPKGLDDLIKRYQVARDEARGSAEYARQDNPASYAGGEIAGTIGTAFVPGLGWMNAGKEAATVAKLAAAAKAGAVMGAGTSNADLTKGQVGYFASDTAEGAATGAALQGVMSGSEGALSGAINRFKSLPEQRAVKAVTGQNVSALRQIAGTTLKSAGDVGDANRQITKVGRDILDEPGVLTSLSKVEDIAPKLSDARVKYGELIGEVGKKIDESVPNAVDAKSISQKIMDYAAQIPPTQAGKRLQDRLTEEAANFEKIGALSFEDAQKFKNQFKYKAVDADALISNQDATNQVRRIIGGQMDQTAEQLAANGPQEVKDLLGNYKLYKSKYGSFKAASDAATDRVQKNVTNRFVSPSDYGVGSAVGVAQTLAHGGPSLTALAAAGAAAMGNKFARERGSALAAKSADAIVKTLKSDGVQAFIDAAKPIVDGVRKGNPAAIATFQILSQSNPQAVKILENQQIDAMQRRMGNQ